MIFVDIPYERPQVVLQAEVTEEGQAQIVAYPTDYTADLTLEKFQSFNLGDQLEPACQKVKDRVKLLSSKFISESIKKSWREGLLFPNIVTLHVDLQPWIQWSALEVKIREALPMPVNFVQLLNPLATTPLHLQVKAHDDALSLQLETLPELEKRLGVFHSPELLTLGSSSIIVSSVPLVCDLAQGKVELSYGPAGETPLQWVK